MGICAFWQLYDNIVPLILKNSFEMGDTLTGVVMAADNVLAVILLPVLGAWSDRTNTRLGKRMPFIIAGTLLSVALMMLIPLADSSRNLALFIVSLGAVLVSMGLYRSPAVALMPDLTPPRLRSQGNAVVNVMGALGALFTLVLIQVLVEHTATPDYLPLFACVAALMLAALAALLATVRERKLAAAVAREYPELADYGAEAGSGAGGAAPSASGAGPSAGVPHGKEAHHALPPDIKRSLAFALGALFFYYMAYNGITTAFSRYSQEVWGLAGGTFALPLIVVAVSAFASYIPLGHLAAKFGRKRVIGLGFASMLAVFVAMSAIGEYHGWVNILFVAVGVGGSAVGVNIFPVVIDMCDQADIGKYTGLYYTFSMAAQIITPIASGFLMQHIGYSTLFPYAAAFSALGLAAILQVRHGVSAK